MLYHTHFSVNAVPRPSTPTLLWMVHHDHPAVDARPHPSCCGSCTTPTSLWKLYAPILLCMLHHVHLTMEVVCTHPAVDAAPCPPCCGSAPHPPLVGPFLLSTACCSSVMFSLRTTSASADLSNWMSSSCIWTRCSREAIRSDTSMLLAADALSSRPKRSIG